MDNAQEVDENIVYLGRMKIMFTVVCVYPLQASREW